MRKGAYETCSIGALGYTVWLAKPESAQGVKGRISSLFTLWTDLNNEQPPFVILAKGGASLREQSDKFEFNDIMFLVFSQFLFSDFQVEV